MKSITEEVPIPRAKRTLNDKPVESLERERSEGFAHHGEEGDEAALHDFVENAPIGLHWVGPDGTILWANKTELDLLGYTREEYVGHHSAEFHADESAIQDILGRLTRGETVHEYEARLRCKDGSTRHVAISCNALFADGKFVHTRCFTRDITARKQGEAQLQENERRFREMIDALPVAIYTTDAEGLLTHFNPAAVEFSGRVPELGTDQWCVTWKLFWPDGTPMPHDQCPMAVALKEGRIIRGVEAIAQRPDGSRVWFTPYPTPLRDAEGKIVGGINMLVDITARKQADETRARLAAIVESSDDAIVGKDFNGVITSWNEGAERLFGYTAQEAIGQPVTMLIPADHVDEEPGILERIRRRERIHHYETVRRRKDGTLFNVSLTVSPIADSQGRIVGASKIARDISERKCREKALREVHELLADRAKHLEKRVDERTMKLRETIGDLEAFSYSIAHDMRAPLRAMQGFANMLRDEYAEGISAAGQDCIRRISVSANRLDRLILDVLNYSKTLRGEMKLEPVDVGRLVQEIIESYPKLQPSRATIMVQAGLPVVQGNAAALTQAISNLLSNAVKFVAPGTLPQIKVLAEQNGEWTRLWFEDNGIGIRKEAVERIFQMFGRINPPDQFEGTGIGLTIVRKAVERMGGKVGVESEPGQGSRFWIQLKTAGASPVPPIQ